MFKTVYGCDVRGDREGGASCRTTTCVPSLSSSLLWSPRRKGSGRDDPCTSRWTVNRGDPELGQTVSVTWQATVDLGTNTEFVLSTGTEFEGPEEEGQRTTPFGIKTRVRPWTLPESTKPLHTTRPPSPEWSSNTCPVPRRSFSEWAPSLLGPGHSTGPYQSMYRIVYGCGVWGDREVWDTVCIGPSSSLDPHVYAVFISTRLNGIFCPVSVTKPLLSSVVIRSLSSTSDHFGIVG